MNDVKKSNMHVYIKKAFFFLFAYLQDGVDHEPKKDLRSRGLCLVPVSFTLHVGSDNGGDYWAPTFGGGFR